MRHARIATARARKLASSFPALVILGARQIGKSTLAELAFPAFERLDLERPRDLDRLSRDPEFVLGEHTRWGSHRRVRELYSPCLRTTKAAFAI
jgi:uncharacterized protein